MGADAEFQWHPDARLLDGRGREQHPIRQAVPVIAEQPSAMALAMALASTSQGFRIGPGSAPPAPASHPVFETLTSGSTGTPRRIRRSQASWIASFVVNAQLFSVGTGVRIAVLGRLVQSLSLYGALEGMHLGAEVHLLDDLRPDRQRKALEKRQISVLYAAPAQLRMMTETAGPVCQALRVILIGGSKLDPALRAAVQDMAPSAVLHEFYGAAETSFITLADATTPEGSVGRAYPGVEIEVRAGLIWVRSPYLFERYADDPGGAEWSDGWLSVGEIGRLEAGYLYLSGRAGRMVTVADQNVFPEQIEALMLTLPGVRQAAVLPVSDSLRGVVLLAVLQGDPLTEPAIMAALRRELGPLKAPKALIWRQDWPTLPSGKTNLVALQRGLAWPI
ncbi:AMP-binding protein [Tabrizicola sp.]|uniref:AMP-binding protein n=1 Tax=Tabrizicola sp. TaxID=2005166 RepID=UPI00286A3A7B|nr:AMP-binding protein [Tabrizicola sp.]